MDTSKYAIGYYPAPGSHYKWVQKDHIEKAPQWCSVDLRDGNQSLVIPMSLEEKLEFYHMLLAIGFKEIEVGFPAASETEYEFLRTLIENNMIPKDVSVQVLTQCREHIIRKTFDACKGAPSAIIHFYNSVSVAQREQVFRKSKEEIKQIAVEGAKLVKRLAAEYEGNFRFEYSPESFTGTEPEYALEVCNAVLDVLEPGPDNNVIINLPVTVEMSMPHIYASQVEYMSENLKYRQYVTLSLHPHNDRGTGVADTELALLAGADRVEGTLFGNGERTGNVDIITLAMNMYSHGVDPELDFSDMPGICKTYEDCTRMHVYERSPYAGALVFAAFSGSHQDAIAKGMQWRKEKNLHQWTVPYLPVDPRDISRTYDADVIRVNAVGVHVQCQCDNVYVAGALAVAEEGALHTIRACQQSQFGIGHAGAPVVVGMQGQGHMLPVLEVFVDVLHLTGVDVRHAHFHGDGEVDDHVVVRAGFQYVQNLVADFQSVLRLRAGEALGRILKAEVSFIFRS